jgi:peptidoglycan hydrolase-like protein with peptidoglycan-binding domain
MRAIRLISATLSVALVLGLNTAQVSSAVTESAKESLISSLVTSAQTAQQSYGVPASVSIAQAMVNTDWGTSALASSAKNYYNARCAALLTEWGFNDLAVKQVGKRYILGAEAAASNPNPTAFDCSELTQWLYSRSGNTLTDLAAAQYDATYKVTSTPKVGDMVFLRNNPARSNGIGHVAVITKKLAKGDWQIIEARGSKYGVVKTTLSYWKKRSYFAGVRRYAKLNLGGVAGVLLASSLSSYQNGCVSITTNGTTTKYRNYTSASNSLLDHAATVSASSAYAGVRAVMNNTSAYIDAIAGAESATPAAYAAAIRSVISTYNLSKYDEAPLNIVLESGAKGAKVTALQQLVAASVSGTKITGSYDSATVAAVKTYQSSKSLTADGQAGPKTITSLMATLSQGSTGTKVSALKTLLSFAGYTTTDGTTLDATTVASLKSFQSKVGISATGTTTKDTWSRLFMLLETASTPSISGTAMAGKTLTAQVGAWGPGSIDLTFQWYRNGTAIGGATASTYSLGLADIGQVVSVHVTGSRATYTTMARSSASSATIQPGWIRTGKATISGTARRGRTLKAYPGSWSPWPKLNYQWYRNGKVISGARSSKYKLINADRGKTVMVKVTGTKAGYATVVKSASKKVSKR